MLSDRPDHTADQTADHLVHNYHPIPVRIARTHGARVTDENGREYLDLLSAYSAMNFGHGHPALVAAAQRQLTEMTLVSRAFDHTLLDRFATDLCALLGTETMVPMNTGAEAVETAIKVARKWAHDVKGVPENGAEIIVMDGNFHGRTTTIVSFSSDPDARDGFGPFTPGFISVPYGDLAAIEAAITPRTAAVLFEPIQGESGVIVPPADFLPGLRELCTREQVLMVADEVQSGLGRTGTTTACERAEVQPDLYVLGKALGGGIVPVSAVTGRRSVLSVLTPGTHGSTFGGNPLACAVGMAVVELLETGDMQRRARALGAVLEQELTPLIGRGLTAVRVVGLWAGLDIDPTLASGRQVCEALAARGVLAKDTHGSTIRFSPPIVIEESDLRWAVAQLSEVLTELMAR